MDLAMRQIGPVVVRRHQRVDRRPADEDLARFIDTLRRSGVSVKVRKRKGSEIDAACGQLRRRAEQESGDRRQGAREST